MHLKIIVYYKNIPSGHSISTIWTFDSIEKKHNACKVEDCMENICGYSR